ncbi:MAG: reverse transcriptase/maturase family protein, partial [Nanoarchaeota archaeon]
MKGLFGRPLYVNNHNYQGNANDRNNLHNNSRFLRISHSTIITVKENNCSYAELCSYDNLLFAFKKARKGKTLRPEVIEFEKDFNENILQLRMELLFHAYRPMPLKSFLIRDPKTRMINKSAFRDRVVHHALFNIIEPLFEKRFIYDSYANRKGKGVLAAFERFDLFKMKVSHNNTHSCFVLKADIKHYFEEVNHQHLLSILEKRILNSEIIWLIKIILSNFQSKEKGRGMPLGNLTSQFFANVYLHELDFFVKQKLQVKYYLRYVDDFVLLHHSRDKLEEYKLKIQEFLQNQLALQLHPQKTRIITLSCGIGFLGMRIFFHHKLLQRKNILSLWRKWETLQKKYLTKEASYDKLYDFIEGWIAYAKQANTYSTRQKIISG